MATAKPDASQRQPDPRLAGDDRNLLAVEDLNEGLSFEDHVYLFWNAHKWKVVIGITALILAVVGRQTWVYVEQMQAAAARDAYAEAVREGPLALEAFAGRHGGRPLGGLAALQVADAKFAQAEYLAAAGWYERASAALAGAPQWGRARIGAAVARLRAGEVEAAVAALEAVADDGAALPAIRAEATYHLAVVAAAAGDRARAQVWIDRAAEIDGLDGRWGQLAQTLPNRFPGTFREAPAPVPAPEAAPAPAEPAPAP